MYTSTRKLRAFRPIADVLEPMSLVSVLVPAFPRSDGLQADLAGLDDRRFSRDSESTTSLIPLNQHADAQPTVEMPKVPAGVDKASNEANLSDTKAVMAMPGHTSGFVSSLNVSTAPNPIGLEDVWRPTLNGRDVTATTNQPGIAIVNAPDQAGSSENEDGIRPLTLPPTNPGFEMSFDGSGGGGSGYDDSGGSGGEPASDLDPNLLLSGGGAGSEQKKDENGQPIPGEYFVPDGVPVGAVVTVEVSSPQTDYVIQTVTWGGGTDIKSYLSANPIQSPPKNQELETGVLTNQMLYNFIINADATHYAVSANVVYTNGAEGTATVEFDSVRPSAANLVVSQVGTQESGSSAATSQVVVILQPGIKIQATVTTHQKHGGHFMFMQIINSTRSEVTRLEQNVEVTRFIENNITIPQGEDFNGPLHDNGSLNTIAYPHTYEGTEMYGWHLSPGHSMPVPGNPTPAPPEMLDMPQLRVPDTYLGLSKADSFSTYLMYRPMSGVWVALNQVDWSWSKSAVKSGDEWTSDPPSPQPTPSSQTPAGSAAFPTWVNLATNYLDQAKNPLRLV